MASAAILAIAGFTALGSIFDYPKILKEPTDEILTAYRADQAAISVWFLVLVISAALLAADRHPARAPRRRLSRSVDRRARHRRGRGTGRRPVTVGRPRRLTSAPPRFELLHTWLGTVLGETIGYALTAAFTVLVVRRPSPAPRW